MRLFTPVGLLARVSKNCVSFFDAPLLVGGPLPISLWARIRGPASPVMIGSTFAERYKERKCTRETYYVRHLKTPPRASRQAGSRTT